jgi:hypothetical protein
MSVSPLIQKLRDLEDYQNAELFGHACARQIARSAGMTFDQVVNDLDTALLSRDRQRIHLFFESRRSL